MSKSILGNMTEQEKAKLKEQCEFILKACFSEDNPAIVSPEMYDAFAELGLCEQRDKTPIISDPELAEKIIADLEKSLFCASTRCYEECKGHYVNDILIKESQWGTSKLELAFEDIVKMWNYDGNIIQITSKHIDKAVL